MPMLRTLIAALFLFQAAGLSELLCAGEDACGTVPAAAESHEGEAQHHDDGDAACQWHCLCGAAGLQAPVATGLLRPSFVQQGLWSGPYSFVPMAPSANIFHPPA